MQPGRCGQGGAARAVRPGRCGPCGAANPVKQPISVQPDRGQGDATRAMWPRRCGQGGAACAVRPTPSRNPSAFSRSSRALRPLGRPSASPRTNQGKPARAVRPGRCGQGVAPGRASQVDRATASAETPQHAPARTSEADQAERARPSGPTQSRKVLAFSQHARASPGANARTWLARCQRTIGEAPACTAPEHQ